MVNPHGLANDVQQNPSHQKILMHHHKIPNPLAFAEEKSTSGKLERIAPFDVEQTLGVIASDIVEKCAQIDSVISEEELDDEKLHELCGNIHCSLLTAFQLCKQDIQVLKSFENRLCAYAEVNPSLVNACQWFNGGRCRFDGVQVVKTEYFTLVIDNLSRLHENIWTDHNPYLECNHFYSGLLSGEFDTKKRLRLYFTQGAVDDNNEERVTVEVGDSVQDTTNDKIDDMRRNFLQAVKPEARFMTHEEMGLEDHHGESPPQTLVPSTHGENHLSTYRTHSYPRQAEKRQSLERAFPEWVKNVVLNGLHADSTGHGHTSWLVNDFKNVRIVMNRAAIEKIAQRIKKSADVVGQETLYTKLDLLPNGKRILLLWACCPDEDEMVRTLDNMPANLQKQMYAAGRNLAKKREDQPPLYSLCLLRLTDASFLNIDSSNNGSNGSDNDGADSENSTESDCTSAAGANDADSELDTTAETESVDSEDAAKPVDIVYTKRVHVNDVSTRILWKRLPRGVSKPTEETALDVIKWNEACRFFLDHATQLQVNLYGKSNTVEHEIGLKRTQVMERFKAQINGLLDLVHEVVEWLVDDMTSVDDAGARYRVESDEVPGPIGDEISEVNVNLCNGKRSVKFERVGGGSKILKAGY